MAWHAEDGVRELEGALAHFDWRTAEELVQQFVRQVYDSEGPLPEQTTGAFLRVLRGKRKFDLLLIAADALIERYPGDFAARQAYAQALLERGYLAAASTALEALAKDGAEVAAGAGPADMRRKAEHANLQARGLLGRLYKQRYVESSAAHVEPNARAMQRGIDYYWDAYCACPTGPQKRWHGINAVALSARALRDGLAPSLGFSPRELAEELLAALEITAVNAWDFATGVEASIATGDQDALGYWLERYLRSPDVDAFEVGSLLRQLTDLWQLDSNVAPGLLLLPRLRTQLRRLEGGSAEHDRSTPEPALLRDAGFERRFGAGFVPIQSYLRGLERACAVARLAPSDLPGDGTGFLVRGGDLHRSWGEEVLLVTSSHVLARPGTEGWHVLEPDDAVATFTFGGAGEAAPISYRVREVLWQSPYSELDTTVCRLKQTPANAKPCPLRRSPLPEPVDQARVFVAGHPGGDDLKFSLYNNRVQAQDSTRLHYRAATLPGSSGSPVFDSHWRVVAIHHRGSEQLERLDGNGCCPGNQGIRISAVIEAIRAELPLSAVERGEGCLRSGETPGK